MPKKLKPIISPEEIQSIVERIATEIRMDFKEKTPVLIGTLNGAFIFMADLIRSLGIPLEADFIQTSCYPECDTPSREVSIIKDITTDIKGRDVIVVEDIVDRGKTAEAVMGHLWAKAPASIKLCSLLARDAHESGAGIDYLGRRIGAGFVVGYGMDFKGLYRELKGLYVVE